MVLQVQVAETFRVGALLVQASMGAAVPPPTDARVRHLSDDERAAAVRFMLRHGSTNVVVSCIESQSGDVMSSQRSVMALISIEGRRFQVKIREDAIGILEMADA